MGSYYLVKFKNEINYNNEINDVFSPFTRGLSQLIGNHLNGSESLLFKVQSATGVELEFITEPNLYNYKLDELQFDFADEDEKERLRNVQKEPDNEAHKAWYNIDFFTIKLSFAIKSLLESDELNSLEYNRKRWLNYLDNGKFINDLKLLHALLSSAKEQHQIEFTYLIY